MAVGGEQSNSRSASRPFSPSTSEYLGNNRETSRRHPCPGLTALILTWLDPAHDRLTTSSAPITIARSGSLGLPIDLLSFPPIQPPSSLLFFFSFFFLCCFCLTLSERCTLLLGFFSSFETTKTTTTHCSETAPATPDRQPRRPRGSRHSVTTTRRQTHAHTRTHAHTIHPPE